MNLIMRSWRYLLYPRSLDWIALTRLRSWILNSTVPSSIYHLCPYPLSHIVLPPLRHHRTMQGDGSMPPPGAPPGALPPGGVMHIPNYINPETRRAELLGVQISLCLLTLLIAGLRLFTRKMLRKGFELNDYLIMVAMVSTAGRRCHGGPWRT